MTSVRPVTSSAYKPAAAVGETPLTRRIGRDIFTRVIVPFLSQKSNPAPDQAVLRRKFGEYSLLLESHKTGLSEKDRIDAAQMQLGSKRKITLKAIREFEKTISQKFSSSEILELQLFDSDIADDECVDLLKRLPELVDVRIMQCSNITNEALREISESHPALQSFTITNSNHITDVGINFITSGCTLIRSLFFIKCAKITDLGLGYIGKYCPELRHLTCRGSSEVTDVGIRYVAMGCKKLTTLDVSSTNISDYALGYIFREFPHLEGLEIVDCKEITDVGIGHLGSTRLFRLDCSGTKITLPAIEKLFARCLKLQHVECSSKSITREDFHLPAPRTTI